MSDKISDEVFDTLPKKPNFLLVLLLSGITMLILFVGAYLLLSENGKKLILKVHHTSQVVTAKSGVTNV